MSEETKNFLIIGAAGYVAPRHMKAIKDVGGNLVAVLDTHDSVGILDKWFPDALYFSEFERFDRFCEKYTSTKKIHYVSIASPNYLHSSHILFALRIGADAICEKPTVLKERNLDQLVEAEKRYGRRVWNVMQMRLHHNAKSFMTNFSETRLEMMKSGESSRFEIEYVTPRGPWYQRSWKGDESKSGGLATNIGIHLFDFVSSWFWRIPDYINILTNGPKQVSGSMEFFKSHGKMSGTVTFYLSVVGERKRIFKFFHGNGNKPVNIDFTDGFDDLHTRTYEEILNDRGFGLEDARNGIKICEQIRRIHVEGFR